MITINHPSLSVAARIATMALKADGYEGPLEWERQPDGLWHGFGEGRTHRASIRGLDKGTFSG